jgi:hypothetical protein
MVAYADWSEEAEKLLARSGWYRGRRVDERVEAWRRQLAEGDNFQMFPAAEVALREFGGICVRSEGPGIECARGSVDLDPELARGERQRFERFKGVIGQDTFPLGEAYDGHAFLVIDRLGRVLLIGEGVHLLGENIRKALDAVLTGRQPKELDS